MGRPMVVRNLQTKKDDIVNITPEIKAIVAESGVQEGIVVVHISHTTAALLCTSHWDVKGHIEIMQELDRLVPTRVNMLHQDSPSDASGHVKSAIVGVSVTVPISGGEMVLSHSQGIFFAEFDGPRHRSYDVKVIDG